MQGNFNIKRLLVSFFVAMSIHIFGVFLAYKMGSADIFSFSYPEHCWFLILYSLFNSTIIALYRGIDTKRKTELLRLGYTTHKLFYSKNEKRKFNLHYFMDSVEGGLPMAFAYYIIIWEPVSNHVLWFLITLFIGLLCGIIFVKSMGRTLLFLNKKNNPNEET